MSISLEGRVALRDLMAQAWQQVEGQAREMLKRSIEGLLKAERDRRVGDAQQQGEKVYRWGYTVRKCWTTLWGGRAVRVPRLRGRRSGLAGKVSASRLGRCLVRADGGGAEPVQGGAVGAPFLRGEPVGGDDWSGAEPSAGRSREAAAGAFAGGGIRGAGGGWGVYPLPAARRTGGARGGIAGGGGGA